MQDLRILFTDREAYRYRFGHGTQDGDSLTHLIAQEENAREEQRLELEYPIFNLWRLLRFVRKTRVTDPGTSDDWFFLFVIWSLITVGLRLFEILFTIATSEGEVTFSCFPLMATAVVTGFVTPHLIHGRTWLKHRHERQKERERIRSTQWTDALVERTRLHIEEHRRLLLGDENNSSNDGTSGEIQSALRELELRIEQEVAKLRDTINPILWAHDTGSRTANLRVTAEATPSTVPPVQHIAAVREDVPTAKRRG